MAPILASAGGGPEAPHAQEGPGAPLPAGAWDQAPPAGPGPLPAGGADQAPPAGPGPLPAGSTSASSPLGLHRVAALAGVLPQAALRLDARPETRPDEVRVRVEWLNLDAASFHQLRDAHGGDPAEVRTSSR